MINIVLPPGWAAIETAEQIHIYPPGYFDEPAVAIRAIDALESVANNALDNMALVATTRPPAPTPETAVKRPESDRRAKVVDSDDAGRVATRVEREAIQHPDSDTRQAWRRNGQTTPPPAPPTVKPATPATVTADRKEAILRSESTKLGYTPDAEDTKRVRDFEGQDEQTLANRISRYVQMRVVMGTLMEECATRGIAPHGKIWALVVPLIVDGKAGGDEVLGLMANGLNAEEIVAALTLSAEHTEAMVEADAVIAESQAALAEPILPSPPLPHMIEAAEGEEAADKTDTADETLTLPADADLAEKLAELGEKNGHGPVTPEERGALALDMLGIAKKRRQAYEANGVTTIEQLAGAPVEELAELASVPADRVLKDQQAAQTYIYPPDEG